MDLLKLFFELFIAFFVATVVIGCLKLAHVHLGWVWFDLSLAGTLLFGGIVGFVVWIFIHYMSKM